MSWSNVELTRCSRCFEMIARLHYFYWFLRNISMYTWYIYIKVCLQNYIDYFYLWKDKSIAFQRALSYHCFHTESLINAIPPPMQIFIQKCFYTRETIDNFVWSVMGYLWKIFKLLPFFRNSSQWESKKSPEILYHHFWKDLIFPNKFKCETFFLAENILIS